jgi:hypothetical protein
LRRGRINHDRRGERVHRRGAEKIGNGFPPHTCP